MKCQPQILAFEIVSDRLQSCVNLIATISSKPIVPTGYKTCNKKYPANYYIIPSLRFFFIVYNSVFIQNI